MRRSRKFVGSSSNSKLGECSSRAASLTRVCHPPDSTLIGPSEIGPLELELGRHLATFPVGLPAIAHQEIEYRLARQERVMLAQIAQPQSGMPENVAPIELFFTQQNLEQRTLSRPRSVRQSRPSHHR